MAASATCCARDEQQPLSVDGRNLYFYFDRKKKSAVLNGANIKVAKGVIYSLLGPSGCGKTTLLKCIVGQHKLQKGSLKIYGKVPGSKGFFIPGRGVGYMPQDLALYPDMTVEETLRYFGSLYQMKQEEINERVPFLLQLLAIPDKTTQIKSLSGGQQRRVSFAATLVHKPPLLLLDEPTVGVDPLLRQAIWKHLVTLANKDGITIIITTHYIEEARQADVVGLMQDGRLLVQENPEILIRRYGVTTLEGVFLKLCQNNGADDPEINESALTSVQSFNSLRNAEDAIELKTNSVKIDFVHEADKSECNEEKKGVQDNTTDQLLPPVNFSEYGSLSSRTAFLESWTRMICLTNKNFSRLKRNIIFMIFQMLIPAIQTMFYCECIGANPFDLTVAVVNMENDMEGFGDNFFHALDNRTISAKHFSNLSSALESVKRGESWAAAHISPDFTSCLINRFLEGPDVDNETIECSRVKLHLDMTNQLIVTTIYSSFLTSFQSFASDLLVKFDKNPLVSELPLDIGDAIYGSSEGTILEFMAPGIILFLINMMAVGLTAMTIIYERKQGILDRIFVAGATPAEVLISLFVTLVLILFVQVMLVLGYAFLIYKIPCRGPFFWVMVCVMLAGLSGMSFGLLISSACDDENTAISLAISSFFPNILLSGALWPLESMPYYLRYISYACPLTLIANSMRSMLLRGWSISENQVWDGFVVSLSWTVGLFLLSMLLFKIRK